MNINDIKSTKEIDLSEKRKRVRETINMLGDFKGLNTYFAQHQKYNEINAVYVDELDKRFYQIIVNLDELEDINGLFDDIKNYVDNCSGNLLNAYHTFDRSDKNFYCFHNPSYDRTDLMKQYGECLHENVANQFRFKIKKVIFNDPATIVIWWDGSKTIVKCQDGDTFDKEKGLAMAISKRALGNKGKYCDEFKKWIPEVKEKVKSASPYSDAAAALEKLGKALTKFNKRLEE